MEPSPAGGRSGAAGCPRPARGTLSLLLVSPGRVPPPSELGYGFPQRSSPPATDRRPGGALRTGSPSFGTLAVGCFSRAVHHLAAAVLYKFENTPRHYVTSRHSLMTLGLTARNSPKTPGHARHSLMALGLTARNSPKTLGHAR